MGFTNGSRGLHVVRPPVALPKKRFHRKIPCSATSNSPQPLIALPHCDSPSGSSQGQALAKGNEQWTTLPPWVALGCRRSVLLLPGIPPLVVRVGRRRVFFFCCSFFSFSSTAITSHPLFASRFFALTTHGTKALSNGSLRSNLMSAPLVTLPPSSRRPPLPCRPSSA